MVRDKIEVKITRKDKFSLKIQICVIGYSQHSQHEQSKSIQDAIYMHVQDQCGSNIKGGH